MRCTLRFNIWIRNRNDVSKKTTTAFLATHRQIYTLVALGFQNDLLQIFIKFLRLHFLIFENNKMCPKTFEQHCKLELSNGDNQYDFCLKLH